MPINKIKVSSHVSRDFLQNSQYFNTLPKVIWEYVSNSLDNAKDDIPAIVSVDLIPTNPKKLIISDNCVGMSRDDLIHFFQMHGVNTLRKKGKRVRGRFGTGKSASFGIANSLEIDTVKSGKRNLVKLTRHAIIEASHGNEFPVEEIIVDETVSNNDQKDGTKIIISDFIINKINFEQSILFIERHLSRYKSKATVIINGHTCKFNEPGNIKKYEFKSENGVANLLGEISLIIKVSPKPLEPDLNGIDILSYGIWHGTTLAGIENKELSNRIFGEIDVEKLEDFEGPIPAFDNTRNNQLNINNPLVITLIAWIGSKIELVRKELVLEEQERKKSEQFKRLDESSKEIEKILNDDFNKLIEQYELARKVNANQSIRTSLIDGGEGEILPGDGDLPSRWQISGQEHGEGKKGKLPPGEGQTPREFGPNLINGNQTGSPKSLSKVNSNKRQKRGIFSIEWIEGTPEDKRSEFKKEDRTIYINLKHPQVESVLKSSGGSVESRQFKETIYEIAIVEYSLAVQNERAENEDLDPFDAIFDIRDIIDRLTKKIYQVLPN